MQQKQKQIITKKIRTFLQILFFLQVEILF